MENEGIDDLHQIVINVYDFFQTMRDNTFSIYNCSDLALQKVVGDALGLLWC